MLTKQEESFLLESNHIEGIHRPLTDGEIQAFLRFNKLPVVTVQDMEEYVSEIQPYAVLRNRVGLNVRVGDHYPPAGSPKIKSSLKDILVWANSHKGSHAIAYDLHHRYETLHPFTDGNGRSGRMLWWWMVGGSSIGFLHHWYYSSLSVTRGFSHVKV